MGQTWMRSGSTGPAHNIRLFGSSLLTTTCQTTLSREKAVRVPTKQVGLANRPGCTILLPVDGEETCEKCKDVEIAQA